MIKNPSATTGDFMRGLKTSAHQLPQLAGGAVAFGGDVLERTSKALGGDGVVGKAVTDYGLGVYKKHEADTQQLSKPSDSFTHVLQNPNEAGSFLKYTAGYVGGQALESLAAAGAGALAGSEVPVAGNVAGAVTGLVAKDAVKRMVLKKAAELVAEKSLSREAAEAAAKTAVNKRLGAAAGSAAANFGMNETQELGSIYGDARDQAQQDGRELTGGDLARVGGASLAAAGVDTLADQLNLGAVTKGVSAPVEQAGKSMLRQRLGAAGKEVAKDAAREAATEAAQTVIERAGAGQSLNDSAALQDIVDSAAAGAVGGAGAGGIASLHTRKNETTPPAAVPHPDAAPGSLSDAANVLAEPAGPMGRAAQAAQVGGLRPNEAGAEAAGVPPAPAPAAQSPLQAAVAEYHATAAQADASGIPPDVFIDRLAQKHGASAQGLWNAVTGDRAAPADTTTEPAAPAPASAALPWVNATTGEVGKPTKGQLTQVLADHIVQTFDTQGHMRINADDLAAQWGVTKKMINQVRPAAQEAANNRVRAAQNPALNEPSGNAGQLPGATDGNERVPGAEAAAPATAGAAAAGPANAEPAAISDHGPDRGAEQPDTAVPAAVAGPNAAGDANAALAPAAASGETAAAKKEPSSAEKPNGLPSQPKAQVDGMDRAPGRAGGEGQGGAASEAAPRVPRQAPQEEAASPRAGVPAAEAAQPAPAVASTKTPPTGVVSASGGGKVSSGFTVSAAAKAAERVRVNTSDGEVNGRVRVDRLLAKGYTKVESVPSGNRMRHQMVRSNGAFQPIPAAALDYAKEVVARSENATRETSTHDNPNGESSRVQQLGAHAPAVPESEVPGLSKLRRKGSDDLRSVDGQLPQLPAGHGAEAEPQLLDRQNRHGRELRAGELSVGDAAAAGGKPKVLPSDRVERPTNDGRATRSHRGDESPNAAPSGDRQSAGGSNAETSARGRSKELDHPETQRGSAAVAGMGANSGDKGSNTKAPDRNGNAGGKGSDDAASEQRGNGKKAALDAAAHEAATSPRNDLPDPTPAQIEANNYKLGHITVHGLDISIENPRGSTRSGVGEDGKPWSHVMSDHYGYIRRTEGADGEHIDTYVGPHPDSNRVFVVDQLNQKTGAFDEHKVMLGFRTQGEAVRAYRSNFDPGWKVGKVKDMTVDQFKAWLKDGDTTKPAATAPTVKESLTVEPAAPATTEKSSTVAGKQAPKRGGIATNGAKVRVVGGKLQYVPRAPETLAAYFKPGDVVPSYGGQDRVISADFSEAGNPLVRVIAVDKEGNTKPNERERVHGTMPTERELVAKLGKPVLAEKAATAKPAAAAVADEPALPAATGNTKDAGEELWANRRNSSGKGLGWNDIADLNDTLKAREAVKTKVWPRPNYAELVDGGMPAPIAHVIKQVYDAIATKPQARVPTDQHYQDYIAGVQKLRDAAFAWAKQVMDKTASMDATASAGVSSVAASSGIDPVHAAAIVSALRISANRNFPILDALFPMPAMVDGRSQSRFRTGEQGAANNALAHLLGGNKIVSAMQVSEGSLRDATKAVEKGWPAAQEAWEKTYTIHESKAGEKVRRNGENVTLAEPEFWVSRKVGKRFSSIVADGFKTREEAVDAAKAAYARQRQAGGDGAKAEAPVELQNARTGPERRAANEDVTSDQLRATFGFKGINFGNWMKGDGAKNAAERQAHLNHAYDAFHDLAEIMGLPAKAMSLNGTLGLAIGAQGNGGKKAAAAHFVPGVNEINLTREQGAGSLAHEWAHALDHYFAAQAGGKVAAAKDPFLTEHLTGPLDGIRPEVRRAFKTIVEAMETRPETEAEQAARLSAYQKSGRDGVESVLRTARQAIEQNGKGDKAAALEQFDAMAQRLRVGDIGEGYVKTGKGQMDAAPQVVGQVANLVKETTGRKPDWTDALSSYARMVSGVVAAKSDNTQRAQRVTSDFAKEARKLEGTRTKPYWSTKLEMFARAFQSYVLDKLSVEGNRNSYLTRSQMDPATLKAAQDMGVGEAGDRYPRGAEREAINKAFDTLVGELKTREGENGNVALFSLDRSGAAVEGRVAATLADARNAASQFIGKPIANDNGLVPATVSGVTLGKMLSDSAVRKSTSVVDHVRAVANLDTLYRMGMLDETHADKHGEPTIAAIHRVVAPMVGENGEVLAVKMTVKETTHPGMPNPLYSVETLEVDSTEGVKPARKAPQSGIEREPGQGRHSPQAGFSPDVTRMLEEFKQKLPLFRQTNDSTTAAAPVTAAQEAHTARIKQIATAAMGKWKGDDVPALRVVATPEQLPAAAKVAANGLASNAYKTAAGMYDGRTIWIVASAHKTDPAGIRRILTTMAHEGVGHYGVERIVERELGAGAWTKIEAATERLRNNPELASPSIRAVLDDVGKRYRGADAPTFAKEFLAVTAERGVKNGLLDRAITAVRQWLRRVMPDLRLSEHELRQLLVQSDQYLRVGESQQQRVQSRAAMAFSQNRPALEPVAAQAEAYRTSLSNAMKVGGRTDRPIPIGDAPAWLRAVGGSDHGLSIRKDTVLKATEGERRPGTEVNHDVRMRDIERLPELLADPVMAFKSRTQKNAMVAMLDAKDMSGRQIVAALHLNAADGRYEVHRVASVYGKDGVAGFVREDLRAGRLLYRNEQKSHEWLQSVGLQLPGEEATRGRGDTVVTDGDLVNSAQFSRSDQTDAPAFKRWFGESKVVDPAGNPLPVFHGTADEFDAFDPNRSGSATAHMTATLGSFFAEDRAKAKRYAENASHGVPAEERVIDAYLSIQKPYEMSLKQFMGIDSREESQALRDRLIGEGYDGIHLKDIGQWVAFQPTQIKSASENRGTFDPGNPNIYFSRDENADPDNPRRPKRNFADASASIEAIEAELPKLDRGAFQQVKDWIAGKARDLEPTALGALQLRHVLELASEDPTLKGPAQQYANTYQRMDGDRNSLTVDGAAKVDALVKWARKPGLAGWLGKVRPEAKKLFDFMNAVTQLAVDPTNQYERLLMRDAGNEYKPWTKELIKERTKVLRETALTRSGDDKTRIYDEIKDLQRLPAREKAREQKYPELVRQWNALTPEAKEQFQVMRDHYREQSEALEEATLAHIASLDIPEQNKRAAAALVNRNFADAKVDGVYFPLTRFGDYWLSLTTKDGEYVYAKYESANALQQAEKRFLAAGATIEARGRQDNNYRAKDAPSGTFIGDLMGVLKNAPDTVKDEIYQMYLKALPSLSLRKHGIHRKNIAGFTDDVPRAFASSVFHGAHQLSKARYGWQLTNTLDQMRERMEARRTAVSATEAAHADALIGEINRRHDWILNPTNNALSNKATGIAFTYFLGASPASAIVNLIQVPQIVLPVMGAQHGWGKASAALGRAMKQAIGTGGHIEKVLTGEDLEAYRALAKQGTFQRSATHALAGISEGDQLRSSAGYTKVMNAVSWMFHTSEVINREATGMAAYRLARANGQNVQDALKYADQITNGTHGDYSNANRARYMQGNVQKVVLQFKNYSLAMSWLWGRNFYKAFKGEDVATRQLARRTLTGMLGMTGLFAGVIGMPIFNLLRYGAQALHAVGGDDDEPWDFVTEFRSWLAEHLGETAANVIADGAVSQLGANVASRVSMSDLWFRDADKQLEGEDAYNNMLQSIAGPLGGMIKNMYVGSQQFSDGHTWRGIETMLPTFAKNAMKATRFASQGVNTLTGNPIVQDISTPQALIQAIGFQPTEVAKQQRINNANVNYEQFIENRRQSLMNAFAMAQQAGDADGRSEALDKISVWNRKYPEYPIRMSNLHASLRGRARAAAESDHGIRLNKKLANRVRSEVGAMAQSGE